MASIPILTVVEHSQVSPPPATVGDQLLPLTVFDIFHLPQPPIHFLFFYELSLTKTHFIETIVPNLKNSLSITLKHFFPFAGNLIVFPTATRKPEIRYADGDSVKVAFTECNLDFNDLTGYHPRNCDKFYHLIPLLGEYVKVSDYVKIPLFSLQVTLFPNHGISIGMTMNHCLGDASTEFCFLKAWTLIARCGTDESFLENGTLPIYERVEKFPQLAEKFLKFAKVETFGEDSYQPPKLSGPTDKVRATFILTRTIIDRLKTRVLTQLPTLPYVSSLTIVCAYIWSCIAKSRNDEREAFIIPMDCRKRMDPPLSAAYFGNCVWGSITVAKAILLQGNEGFITAAKLLGDNLHKQLTDKDGVVKDIPMEELFPGGIPQTIIAIAGTPKLNFYDMDFGWGKPKKIEKVSIDYSASISIDANKESNQDLEIGVSLTAAQMQVFVRSFNQGLESYI